MHRSPAAKRSWAGICIGLDTWQVCFGYTADRNNLRLRDGIESAKARRVVAPGLPERTAIRI
jgi:hypothetical protein